MGTDGTVLVPFVPEEPGTLQVIARLTDADGVASANATVGLVVSPPLNVTLIASRSTGVSNVTVDLVGSVVSGAAPFSWTVVPGVAPLALAVDGGVLGTVGSFEWQGVYATETNATGEVIVVDADGAFASSSYSVSTFARLQLVAYLQSAGPTGPGGFALRLDISGGVPPFQVNVTTAALGAWNFTDPRDGWATWTLAVDSGGVLLVRVAVTDALDYRQNWTGETEVASPPPANPTIADTSSTTGSWVVVLVGLATSAVVGAGLAARRAHRRSRPASKPAIDPVEVLRGIIEPAEGADRSTVELLADEAGVPLEAAHVTIDRLIAEGTLCSEKSPEGGEILAWSLDS